MLRKHCRSLSELDPCYFVADVTRFLSFVQCDNGLVFQEISERMGLKLKIINVGQPEQSPILVYTITI